MKPLDPQASGLPTLASTTLDLISKSGLTFGVALYCCGFLITSIYHASYGFTETNPLRPRIVFAGVWFFIFIAIPYILVKSFMKYTAYWDSPDRPWIKYSNILLLYLMMCTAVSFLFFWNFRIDKGYATSAMKTGRFPILVVVMAVLILLVTWDKVPKPLSAAASILYMAYFLQLAFRDLFLAGRFSVNSIGMWFFVIGILIFVEMGMRAATPKMMDWRVIAFSMVGIVVVFATYYYSHIRPSWGGGNLMPVTIYFSKDSVLMPGRTASVFLIDESEAGLYVVGMGDKRATFIPRSAVGMVYFSDQIAPTSLPGSK